MGEVEDTDVAQGGAVGGDMTSENEMMKGLELIGMPKAPVRVLGEKLVRVTTSSSRGAQQS